MLLMAPPAAFLILYGSVLHERAGRIESREFYEKVTDPAIGQAIGEILEEDRGFYRLEQVGSESENAADLNRVWDMGQYISSVYSSSYNKEYQEFRKNTFEVEEPFRNDLMQSVSKNPVFLQLMGVRYLISEEKVPGYELVRNGDGMDMYENRCAAPVAYVTDRLISEDTYDELGFPYNQMALAYGAVRPEEKESPESGSSDGGTAGSGSAENEKAGGRSAEVRQAGSGSAEDEKAENEIKMERQILEEVRQALRPVEIVLPTENTDSLQIVKTETGYRIQADKTGTVRVDISGIGDMDASDADRILFLQFQVKNNHPSQDVAVRLKGERNKLTARNHFYYNGNTTFSFAVLLEQGEQQAELSLGKGDYEITGITGFLGDWTKQTKEEQDRKSVV